MVVGHTSGHWVKPKNRNTTLPLKSAMVRTLPVWSVSLKSRAYSAPVMSTLLKAGGLAANRSQPASSNANAHRARNFFMVRT